MNPANGLEAVLQAEALAATSAVLPSSGRVVEIATYLRTERRLETVIERVATCWAPNKPTIDVDGAPSWAEFSIVHRLRTAGWGACWVKNWTGGREFCAGVGLMAQPPQDALRLFGRIHARAPLLKGAGTWDVFAWREGSYLFIESKQQKSNDRLNANQLTFLEAAIDEGLAPDRFAIVAYQAVRE